MKQLRGFLGLVGYYKRFVKSYGQISRPLTELLKKDSFQWNPEATAAFKELKEALTTAPVLGLPDFSQPFEVETDASGNGIDAVLMQEGRPIAYLSKSLNPTQRTKSVYDHELLAILLAVKKWSQYIVGRTFIIRTDHCSLKFLLEQKLSTLLQHKWLAKLAGYNFVIQYKKGNENQAADALSRLTSQEVALCTISYVTTDLFQ